MNNTIEFQIYDWMEDHEKEEEEDEEDSENNNSGDIGTYIIHTFGRTMEGKSVYMKIVNYTPHFYIKLPLNWSKDEAKHNVSKMLTYFTSDMNKKVWGKFRASLINMDVVERMAAEGFTNGKKYLFARLIFNNNISMKKFRYMFEQSTVYIPGITSKPIQFKTYEANLPPMLRCFHIKKISGCSWVSVSKYIAIDINSRESYCDIELRVDWRDIVPITKDINAPFRTASFDIECYSSDADKFPEAKNKADCIFQIGTTYTHLGNLEPYRQHIVCLRETSPVDGVVLEWYKTEGEMIQAWIRELISQDADIITGWNIFGFDEAYIYERCMGHLDMEREISRISKLKYYKCNFRDFKLESSALGQNNIRMFDTPGRIHVDLMKDVQKNHKLNSYKLDFVSSNFIRDEIYHIEKLDNDRIKLHCDSVDNINVDDYIHFEYALDFISDMIGSKYRVEEIIGKTITITVSDEIKEFLKEDKYTEWENIDYHDEDKRKTRKFKLVWSQAKDDVGPRDIFRMFNEGPDERAIIAKYCVKDCKLVSLLMEKLCIIINNIEMANVCYVPMSFLFTRGQVIKLFSLCLKYYREAGYLFPVLVKPEEKTPSYEGAIVFDPEANVEYEALAVKDYKSLYPSSMIHKNMSHETIVKNEKYDNVENVEYYNASYKEADGRTEYRRFAKVDGKLGVVPQILTDLIAERDAVKKLMKKAKDNPFKYKILNGKQLAVKVTANSLYGATGADTSAIRERDIAACTTSTGREMLKLARHFDENIFPGLFNGYRYALYNGDEEKANKILDMEMKDVNNNELRERIKKYALNEVNEMTFQPIIRYGDSITGDTLVYLRIKGVVHIMPVKDIYQFDTIHYSGYDKEYSEPAEYMETYSDKGWTKIKWIMRHHTNKMIYMIKINDCYVKVTADHSCLLEDGSIISPKDLKIGDKIMIASIDNNLGEIMMRHNIPITSKNIVTDIISMGYVNDYVYDFETENHHFMAGYGNIVVHNTDSIFSCYRFREKVKQIKDSAALDLWKDIVAFGKKLLGYFFEPTEKKIWNELFDKYYDEEFIKDLSLPKGPDYVPPPNHYKIILPVEQRIEQFLLHYMEECYLPWLWTIQDIYTKEYISDTVKNNSIEMKIFNGGINMIDKMMVQCSIGKLEVKTDEDEDDMTRDKKKLERDDRIIAIREFIVDDIQYFIDNKLKTYIIQPYWDYRDANHERVVRVRFYKHGEKITDKRTVNLSMEMGIITGELVKKRLPYPHDLEYEKTFWPFLILTKKRYVGNKYEDDPNDYYQDYNGIVLKRRDNAPIVKEICGGIINRLIDMKDPDMAKQYTIDCMNKMFNNEYNIKYFLTSKTLKMKESYADWTRIAHVVLADRIAKRDPGNCPQSGDRIEFAAIQLPNVNKNTLQGERIETPQYIAEKKLKVDYEFYMTNQIMNPALQFLSLAIPRADKIFDEFKIRTENERMGRTNILDFCKKKN